MAKKSGAPAMDKPLTPAQERVFKAFDGEPMTPTDVSKNLSMTIYTIRGHLRALVERGKIHTTRRGRVIYYHKPGVEVPEGENAAGEGSDADIDRMDTDGTDRMGSDDDESDFEGFMREGNGRRRVGDDDFVDGVVTPAKAVPTYDARAQLLKSLEALEASTDPAKMPVIVEMLEQMETLRGSNSALHSLYADCMAEHGIDEHALIRWYMVLHQLEIDPRRYIEPGPEAPAGEGTDLSADEQGPETIEDRRDEEDADGNDGEVDALADEIARMELLHAMRGTQREPAHLAGAFARAYQMRGTIDSGGRHAIDPRLLPKDHLELFVFNKNPENLGRPETDLVAAVCTLEGRMTAAEWHEYVAIVHVSEHGTVPAKHAARFVELFRKAYPDIPFDKAKKLAMIVLVSPSHRTAEQHAEYETLASAFLNGM